MKGKLTPGKWVNAKFTKKQRQARLKWKTASNHFYNLMDALLLTPETAHRLDRQGWHERLDRHLDNVNLLRVEAKADFPEVSESWTIAHVRFDEGE